MFMVLQNKVAPRNLTVPCTLIAPDTFTIVPDELKESGLESFKVPFAATFSDGADSDPLRVISPEIVGGVVVAISFAISFPNALTSSD
jgi:hypothetical protein